MKAVVRIFLPAFAIVSMFLVQSCNNNDDAYPQLIGDWVEYKNDQVLLPFVDSAIDKSIKWHLEFRDGGMVTEWWVPEEPWEYEYTIKDSTISFQKDRYVIINVDHEELVLDELNDDEEPGVAPRSPYRVKTFFKRIKDDKSFGQ